MDLEMIEWESRLLLMAIEIMGGSEQQIPTQETVIMFGGSTPH